MVLCKSTTFHSNLLHRISVSIHNLYAGIDDNQVLEGGGASKIQSRREERVVILELSLTWFEPFQSTNQNLSSLRQVSLSSQALPSLPLEVRASVRTQGFPASTKTQSSRLISAPALPGQPFGSFLFPHLNSGEENTWGLLADFCRARQAQESP